MPQIRPSEAGNKPAQKPYGVATSDNTKTFQQRMMERFAPQDFVTVVNIDNEALVWQYLPAHAEDFEYTPDPMKITRRALPELWELAPGASEALVGANAYLMLDNLYKKVVAKKVQGDSPEVPGQARNFNYADGGQQEDFLDKAFLGKTTPQFNVQQPDLEPAGVQAPQKEEKTGVSR